MEEMNEGVVTDSRRETAEDSTLRQTGDGDTLRQTGDGGALRETGGMGLEALVERDARAGHFVVDVLAGVDVPEALSRHFGGSGGVLAEAEQRGYLRGLNEAAEARMKEPSMYEQPVPKQPARAPESADGIFTSRRRSIWG